MPVTYSHVRRSRFGMLLAGLIGLGLAAPPASAADLTVTIEGVHGGSGKVVLGLFADPKEWPKGHAAYQVATPASDGKVIYVFKTLPPGRYALTGFYDENNNGKMDYTFVGLPKEGFLFSNDRSPGLSAPSFDACAFTIGDDDAALTVHIQQWGS